MDASTSVVQVGILHNGNWLAFYEGEDESLNAIFKGSDKCLKDSHCKLEELDGFLICEGPGSILGLRLVIMAVKTWCSYAPLRQSKVYHYRSLEVAARLLSIQKIKHPLHVISDFKKDKWNLLTINKDQSFQKSRHVSAQSLKDLPESLWYIHQRKNGYPPPVEVNEFKYSLKLLPTLLGEDSLFHHVHDLNLINSGGKSEFAKWQVQRHRKD